MLFFSAFEQEERISREIWSDTGFHTTPTRSRFWMEIRTLEERNLRQIFKAEFPSNFYQSLQVKRLGVFIVQIAASFELTALGVLLMVVVVVIPRQNELSMINKLSVNRF